MFFNAVSQLWNKNKDLSGGAIGKEVWDAIAAHIQPNSKTLEFGCGLSTLLFDYAGHDHRAVDNVPKWIELVKSHDLSSRTTLIHSDLNDNGFYSNIPIDIYDCVLIDGPAGEGNRKGVPDIIPQLIRAGSVIVVDDTNRPKDKELSEAIQEAIQASLVIHGETSHGRMFDLIFC